MKVIKVNITQEPMEIEKPWMEVAVVDNSIIDIDKFDPSMMSVTPCKRELWRTREVRWPHENENTHYLVKEGDNDIFDGLIVITDADLKRWFDKKSEQLVGLAEENARVHERARIRYLPWWKRLFKKF